MSLTELSERIGISMTNLSLLKNGKVKGAALDVLEYEKSSFENLFATEISSDFSYLLAADNVLLSPHVAGWSIESNRKLAQIIVRKIILNFKQL